MLSKANLGKYKWKWEHAADFKSEFYNIFDNDICEAVEFWFQCEIQMISVPRDEENIDDIRETFADQSVEKVDDVHEERKEF